MYKWLLLIITGVALLLRLINLSNLPAGFTPDEASFGYDAYSLLKTGADQWGAKYPLTFKSFGDYKLPVYTYLVVPSVFFLGLNEFAVRLPNAVLGALAVPFVYLLVDELVRNKKTALLAALMLAFSYWNISLSRGAFEANLTTFFMTGGVYFFLKARKRDDLLPLSMLFFGINLFTYHSARMVTPIVVMSLLWFFRKSFPRNKKYTFASVVFLGLFIVAILSFLGGSGARASTSTFLTQDLGAGKVRSSIISSGLVGPVARFFYNQPLFEVTKFIQNYGSYFSFDFLLTSGAREATYGMVPGIGVLSAVEFLGFALFIIFSIKKFDKKYLPLVIWLLVAPIPAAISVGPGNAANRAAVILPCIQILADVGLANIFEISKFKKVVVIGSFAMVMLVGSLTVFRYVIEEPIVASDGMMYGMREAFQFLKGYPSTEIVLSDTFSESHIYAMFYDQIPPNLAQQASMAWDLEALKISWVDQQGTYFIGKYTITEPQKTRYAENTLVVSTQEEMPVGMRVLKTIYTPDFTPLLVVATK